VAIGLSTYAYSWRMSERRAQPLTLLEAIADAARRGVDVFQICDHAPLAQASDRELDALRGAAESLGLALELGTRGLRPETLLRHLRLAERLGATLLRSMWTDGDDRPDRAEARRRVEEVLPRFAAAGVVLALETYEQVPTAWLVELVEELGSPQLGICLDPANSVANLEHPDDVVARCAPYVRNWHVKDFDFSRAPGWVGFQLAGTPLGEGRLHYDAIHARLEPERRGLSEIIEFWLPWQGDAETTARREDEWTDSTIDYLRSRHLE
jgi:sugar phosphate isomerase/epimerase